jgi:hypothetical protein
MTPPRQVLVRITRADGAVLLELAWFDFDIQAVVFPPSFPPLRGGDCVSFTVPPPD